MLRCLLLLALASVINSADAGITSVSSLADLDALKAKNEGFVLLVYAPWCGHSRALLPEVERAASLTAGKIGFAKADGTVADDVATKLDIKGYPTLLFVRRGDGPPVEYQGVRKADDVLKWAQSMLKPSVTTLASADELSKWTAQKKTTSLVLFVADEGAAEAEAFRGVAAAEPNLPCAVSTVDPASPLAAASLAALGEVSRPALVAFTAFDEGPSVLRSSASEPLTHSRMLKFVKAAALPAVLTYAAGKAEEEFFAAPVPVHLLFFHSAPLVGPTRAALAAVGKELKGEAALATVDSTAHAELTSFFDVAPSGSLKAPALLGFSVANGTKYLHTGDVTQAAISQFARAVAGGSAQVHLRSQPEAPLSGDLIELVGSNFAKVAMDPSKDVLVQFYSPTCGHCRKLRPTFEAVAAKFADDEELVVAMMDAVANDVLGLEPEGFPMIVLYTKANKRGVEYDGSRDMHDLVQFVSDARAGRSHVGGLPGPEDSPDEDDGYRVEL